MFDLKKSTQGHYLNNIGSSREPDQTYMCLGSRLLLVVLEKKSVKGLSIYAHGGHVRHFSFTVL